jgi:hypothetical protein
MTQVTGSNNAQVSAVPSSTQDEGIQLSLETMYLAFAELNESLESLNTRAGVGLTVLVTALTVMSFRIEIEQISLFGNVWIIILIILTSSLVITSLGIYFLARAIIARPAIGAFNPQKLHEEDWKTPLHSFRLKQLHNLRNAIDDRQRLMAERGRNYNRGIKFALVGIGIYILVQLFSSFFQIASKYVLISVSEKITSTSTNLPSESNKLPASLDKPVQVAPKNLGGKP